MSKLFKLVALCTAGVFLFSGTPYAEVRDLFVPITVGATVPVIEGAGTLTVETHNVSDNALVLPLALNFDTAGIGLPPASNPWVLSSQYLVIDYGMTANNYVAWGVRIVTDNEDLEGDANDVIDSIAGNPIAGNADVDVPPDGDIWGDADDDLSYAGLVVVGDADPSHRAAWAWQAYPAVQPAVTAPTSAIGGSGALVDVGFVGPDRAGPPPVSGGEWNGYWAYIADKNDLDGNADGVNGFIGDLFRDLDGDGADDDITYSMVLVSSATRNGTLAPHPDVAPRVDDDNEIVVYIAGRFANTDYSDPASPTPIVLPVLSYGASLYIELVHE